MLSGQTQLPPALGTNNSADDNICIVTNTTTLIDELSELLAHKRQFEVIIVDSQKSGFLFSTEIFFETSNLAKQLLEVEGSLIFLTSSRAMSIKKDSLIGNLSLNTFASYSELFDHSPTLTKHVLSTSGKADILPEHTDLTQQVLFSSVPVLKEAGIKAKGARQQTNRAGLVLSIIDNFTPISAICLRLIENDISIEYSAS